MLNLLNIPSAYENRLRLGTCSWKYDSWKGLVYDAGKAYQAGDYEGCAPLSIERLLALL